MKLRNKQNGEIAELGYISSSDGCIILQDINTLEFICKYGSLAELNEVWEDYEEPKEYWYIDIDGEINYGVTDNVIIKEMIEIGNYFETREEAEKAVEKLKAWKRLKDKGFRFEWWKEAENALQYNTITFNNFVYNYEDREQLRNDLDLLFGGEE